MLVWNLNRNYRSRFPEWRGEGKGIRDELRHGLVLLTGVQGARIGIGQGVEFRTLASVTNTASPADFRDRQSRIHRRNKGVISFLRLTETTMTSAAIAASMDDAYQIPSFSKSLRQAFWRNSGIKRKSAPRLRIKSRAPRAAIGSVEIRKALNADLLDALPSREFTRWRLTAIHELGVSTFFKVTASQQWPPLDASLTKFFLAGLSLPEASKREVVSMPSA